MNIINKRITEIIPYEKNTKKHDQTQINNVAESIKQYGFVQPLVIDKNNVVVIGHCRLLAAKQLGMEEVPCVCVDDLTEEQVRALRIVDNKSNESEWDFDFLAEELADLDLGDFDFDFGIEQEEEETEIIEDEAPEVDEENEPICKLGDIWQLGKHRLVCGDSTDKETVELLMNGNKADIEFTSPPYNAGASEKLSGNTHTTDSKYLSSSDDLDNYDELLFKSTENGILFSKYAIINIQMLAGNKLVFCDYLHKFKDQLCDIAIWKKQQRHQQWAKE